MWTQAQKAWNYSRSPAGKWEHWTLNSGLSDSRSSTLKHCAISKHINGKQKSLPQISQLYYLGSRLSFPKFHFCLFCKLWVPTRTYPRASVLIIGGSFQSSLLIILCLLVNGAMARDFVLGSLFFYSQTHCKRPLQSHSWHIAKKNHLYIENSQQNCCYLYPWSTSPIKQDLPPSLWQTEAKTQASPLVLPT